MEANDFQKACETTASYMGKGEYLGLTYVGLGLASEAGEACGKIKRINRDNGGVVDDAYREAVAMEIFDTFWYGMQTLTELRLTADEVIQKGLMKLSSRKERGVITGSGDTR